MRRPFRLCRRRGKPAQTQEGIVIDSPATAADARSKTVLLVDDDAAVLETLNHALRLHYRTRIATTGTQALALAATAPDLILLDVELPDMSGYEVCRKLKAVPGMATTPVIFLSSHREVDDITRGLELGAVDYVTKPVLPPILLARVQTHLRLKDAHDQLQHQNQNLERIVSERTRALELRTEELQRSQDLTIMALGSIAETRDNETGNHIHRTRAYVQAMCKHLESRDHYRHDVSREEWTLIWKTAPLHDIGKVGIPDHILLKPGRLTTEEFEKMKRHTTLGRDALVAAEERANVSGAFLRIATAIAYSHHERWDGKGYPQGLSAAAIPVPARLMAVADVYDALISKRVYKEAFNHTVAVDLIRDGRGSQFDPVIVDCFLDLNDEFRNVALRFADADAVSPSAERI
jgi:putative two-component system response regulator